MKRTWMIAALAASVALAACGTKDESNGGVTEEESAGLNNAADMLDTSPDSLVAPDEAPLGNGEAPAMDAIDDAEAPVADNGATAPAQ